MDKNSELQRNSATCLGFPTEETCSNYLPLQVTRHFDNWRGDFTSWSLLHVSFLAMVFITLLFDSEISQRIRLPESESTFPIGWSRPGWSDFFPVLLDMSTMLTIQGVLGLDPAEQKGLESKT